MRKILTILLALAGTSTFALSNYAAYQQFQNQYNLNYTYSQSTLENGAHKNNALATTQFIGVEIERLFNEGVWASLDAKMAVISGTNQGMGIGADTPGYKDLHQGFDLGGINAKVGYAFDLTHNHLVLTPYALAGRNTNLAASTVSEIGNDGYQHVATDAFYTAGAGARLGYRINRAIFLYADQNVAYNWDQSGPRDGHMPQNMVTANSELGAKFRVNKNLLLGLAGNYVNYDYKATAAMDPTIGTTVYQPRHAWSGTASVGLTY